jgi:broad specificity phosphatase PhoE
VKCPRRHPIAENFHESHPLSPNRRRDPRGAGLRADRSQCRGHERHCSGTAGGRLRHLVRHGATFNNQADTEPFNLDEVSKQRNLNDKGKDLAKVFGAAIRAAGVPIGQVYTSQFNRAYETALLAGFNNIQKTIDLSEGGLVVTPDENSRRAQALRTMLAKTPADGKNDILVTHKPNIIDALGKDWFDVKEGEASIFKPEGGSYSLVARVQMEDWPRLTSAGR